MGAALDLVQSAIIAGMIVILVLGVHFMTMKSSTENRVIQQMQGMADVTGSILQEEIRSFHGFCSDSLRIASNNLYFRNNLDQIVYIEAFTDSLVVEKYEVDESTELSTDIIDYFMDSNTIKIPSGYTPPPGRLAITLSALDTFQDSQTKIVKSYDLSGVVEIKGKWDFMPSDEMPQYELYAANRVFKHTYSIDLLDLSAQNDYVFNMIKIDSSGSEVLLAEETLGAKNINLIRVNVTVHSKAEELYQDDNQEFRVNLQKEFFLRGHRLYSTNN